VGDLGDPRTLAKTRLKPRWHPGRLASLRRPRVGERGAEAGV